jgi:acyl dehydratase
LTIIVNSLDELKARAGEHLGHSEWLEVAQDRIDTFAAATDDHQWIHTDPERARSGPFGTTIAHGYLTLSLLIPLWSELVEIRGARTSISYGLNKVRFPAPVPVGAKIRLAATLAAVNDVPGGVEAIVDAVLECEGAAKPACVAQAIYRYYS